MSDTEGWSNRQLNERIQELEGEIQKIGRSLEDGISVGGTFDDLTDIVDEILKGIRRFFE